jgi:hypothetical protein
MKKLSCLLVIAIICSAMTACLIEEEMVEGIVIGKEDGALIVISFGKKYRVLCSNADNFTEKETVSFSYTEENIKELEKNYFEVTVERIGHYDKRVRPMIYLYPTEQTDINIKFKLNGKITDTFPDYRDGWNVTAYPDGKIIDKADGVEYPRLYWEGILDAEEYDFGKGFVVKGTETDAFLQEKLTYLGLAPNEYNEFIENLSPSIYKNKYNLITFQSNAYTENAVLEIKPKPDSILRVFMVYKPLDEYMEIEEQVLTKFERKGFTVVEWGCTWVYD